MKIRYVTLLAAIAGLMAACGNDRKVEPGPSLKEAASGKFLMGVALNVRQAAGQDTYASKVVKRHFNSIVAENCMKCEVIHPEEDRFDFTEADRLVRFGEENDMAVIGHCLIWHSQLAPWFCVDEQGKTVSADILHVLLPYQHKQPHQKPKFQFQPNTPHNSIKHQHTA